ncbi:MAG: hypothetical protein KBS74_03055 [Clostridiales bacterium]|nr:hypothetical protein [Candidatus Cacconaster stercorequi]
MDINDAIFTKFYDHPSSIMEFADTLEGMVTSSHSTPELIEAARQYKNLIHKLFVPDESGRVALYTDQIGKEILACQENLEMHFTNPVRMDLISFSSDTFHATKDLVKQNSVSKNPNGISFDAFLKNAIGGQRTLSQYAASEAEKGKILSDVYAVAENEAGYSQYEFRSKVDAQALKDLCLEYKALCGKDPALIRIINKVDQYAALDASASQNYSAEVKLFKQIQADLDEYAQTVLDQQDKLMDEIRSLREEEYEKRKVELITKEAAVDNRMKIHASLTSYFAGLSVGNLTTPVDYIINEKPQPNDPAQQTNLNETERGVLAANSKPYGIYKGNNFTYINGVGVKVGMQHDTESYGIALATATKVGDFFSGSVSAKDIPIFPHEPRMNDIKQMLLGDCYALAGLQDMARLYPQKIKDMIKDNGDGTATVRFFEKRGSTYRPVYVKVDKVQARIGGLISAGADDCLWANIIERAYIISGLHPTMEYDNYHIPVDAALAEKLYNENKDKQLTDEQLTAIAKQCPQIVKDKKLVPWKPTIGSIEGGQENEFLEACFGRDFAATKIYSTPSNDPQQLTWDENNEAYYQKNVADFDKLGPYERLDRLLLSSSGKTAKEYLMDNYRAAQVSRNISKEDYEKICDIWIRKFAEILNRCKSSDNPRLLDNARYKQFLAQLFSDTANATQEDKLVRGLLAPIIDSQMILFNNTKSTKHAIFDRVCDALEKGFPVSAGTPSGATDVAGTHAYSIIGAYKTNDTPPQMYFRIRNPWGNRENNSGVEHTMDQNGKRISKSVSSKDGIFDMEVNQFFRNYDLIAINGSSQLEKTAHNKTLGFDIITKAQEYAYENGQVKQDAYMALLKNSHDMYSALVSTDHFLSNDSPAYRALKKELLTFDETVAMCRGKEMDSVKDALDSLMQKVTDYEKHVYGNSYGDAAAMAKVKPSSRQSKRLKVCETMKKIQESMLSDPQHPREKIEKDFAEKIVQEGISQYKGTAPIDAKSETLHLLSHRAFRSVVNELSAHQMVNADQKLVTGSLKKIRTIIARQGVEKNVDAASLKGAQFKRSI